MDQKEKNHDFLDNYQLFLKNSGYQKSSITDKDSIVSKKINIFTKPKKVLWTFSKDIILGFSLFGAGVIGTGLIGSIISHSSKLMHNTPIVKQIEKTEINSIFFDNYIQKILLKQDTTKEIATLKAQGLLNEENKNPLFSSPKYTTPLMQAIYFNDFNSVKELINSGANVNFINSDNQSAINAIELNFLSKQNIDNEEKTKTSIEITNYLLSQGLDWKTNNFSILYKTSNSPLWRSFWIDYISKTNPAFIPMYQQILQDRLSPSDSLVLQELKKFKK